MNRRPPHVRENDNTTRRQKFVNTLKEYKEIITIMIFFLGGLFWIMGYFATKSQLEQLNCITRANLDMIQGKMNTSFCEDMIKQINVNILKGKNELEKLRKDYQNTNESENNLSMLEFQRNSWTNDHQKAKKIADDAFQLLNNGGCIQKK